ncbi:hypothetical protein CCAX7_56260 [Capsulimonas corticalis]|uniref:Uncharacterized protein n=1 Tax=Capsulimonas corticalis TaxID=2219043 RepID=A0A402D0K7_9BACT|nr:hypothetical protein CCAX7_56260 [Capsulimonas corticalis]
MPSSAHAPLQPCLALVTAFCRAPRTRERPLSDSNPGADQMHVAIPPRQSTARRFAAARNRDYCDLSTPAPHTPTEATHV